MFKCIKEVTMNEGRAICFKKNKTYDSHHFRYTTGYEVIDDTGEPHIIGQEGSEWFDEHFVDVTEEVKDEKYYVENFLEELSELSGKYGVYIRARHEHDDWYSPLLVNKEDIILADDLAWHKEDEKYWADKKSGWVGDKL